MPPCSRPSSTASTGSASPSSPPPTASPSSPRKRAFILPKPPPANSTDPSPIVRTAEPARVQPRRQQTQNACTACRKRKSKCNGARPSCTSCTRKRTRCFFDPDREGGQVASLRRRHDALAAELRAHRALYAALRAPDPARARELLPRIRAAADVHDAVGRLGLGLADEAAGLEVEVEGDGEEERSPDGGSETPRVQGGVVRSAAAASSPAWDGGAAWRGTHGASAPLVIPMPAPSVIGPSRTGACSLPDIRSFCSGARCVPWVVAAGGLGGGGGAEYVGVAGRRA